MQRDPMTQQPSVGKLLTAIQTRVFGQIVEQAFSPCRLVGFWKKSHPGRFGGCECLHAHVLGAGKAHQASMTSKGEMLMSLFLRSKLCPDLSGYPSLLCVN